MLVTANLVATNVMAVTDGAKTLKLVGEAKLSVLFWDVYEARLYNQTGTYLGLEHPLELQLTYLREISKEDLLEATADELSKQSDSLTTEQISNAIEIFASYWPDIKAGEMLSFSLTPSGGVFYFNGEFIGSVESPEIAQAFMNIWLAETSSFPKLSARLRGESK